MHPKNLFLLFLITLLWTCQKIGSRAGNAIPKGDPISMQNHLELDTNTGVGIGNSIIAGSPWGYSGLQTGVLDHRDTVGQICWYLTQLTKFQWIDHGWGGQTTTQIRARFLRDAIGDTSDPGDGRGSVTLAARPAYVVMEGGVNDIAYRTPLSEIEDNLAWMASTCKQHSIRCIVLNCIGYEGFDTGQAHEITGLNDWLASGALDSDQASIININSLWNSGTYDGVSPYGNDNLHASSLVNPADGVHFTKAGYDSVANAIFIIAIPTFSRVAERRR
jgi:lysophospholipase L1-like esterase